MNATKLPNGNLLIPIRAESDGVVGDAMIEITSDDSRFKAWDGFLSTQGNLLDDELDEPQSV